LVRGAVNRADQCQDRIAMTARAERRVLRDATEDMALALLCEM
jgi:hypothetical protein